MMKEGRPGPIPEKPNIGVFVKNKATGRDTFNKLEDAQAVRDLAVDIDSVNNTISCVVSSCTATEHRHCCRTWRLC